MGHLIVYYQLVTQKAFKAFNTCMSLKGMSFDVLHRYLCIHTARKHTYLLISTYYSQTHVSHCWSGQTSGVEVGRNLCNRGRMQHHVFSQDVMRVGLRCNIASTGYKTLPAQ